MSTHAKKMITQLNTLFKKVLRFITRSIDSRPLASFFTALGLVILLIVLGTILRTPPHVATQTEKKAKEVDVFSIGQAPRLTVQAKIEKSGVIKITALTGGVVQKIYKHEGETISRGSWLFWLSSNYQGGVTASVSRQMAEKNYAFLKDNYDTQKEIIAKNRDIATKIESQSSALRDISSKSIDETKSLISLNENVVSMMDSQITGLESINVNGSSNSAILQLKQGKAQVLSGLNQARAALRSSEYQTNGDNEPAALAQLQRDATLKQLDLQERTLDLNKEVALLNVRLSQIQESLMYPASPFDGVVERIYVKVGQNVTSGTVLATITGSQNTAKAIVLTTRHIAENISRLEPTYFNERNVKLDLFPTYISTEPTDGSLYTIIFAIPDTKASSFSSDQIVEVTIPMGVAQSMSAIPYIPLDAIYQTDSESYVYITVADHGAIHAQSKKIELGEVVGDFVEVKSGITAGDKIILDRTIIEGDLLKIKI
jgi:multidrug efflux pump subunit AcrA (membrane-fusion protein)